MKILCLREKFQKGEQYKFIIFAKDKKKSINKVIKMLYIYNEKTLSHTHTINNSRIDNKRSALGSPFPQSYFISGNTLLST